MFMTNWEEMLDRKIQLAFKKKHIANGLDLYIRPLFTAAIMNYEHPTKFRP